jgi:hypothetical protein
MALLMTNDSANSDSEKTPELTSEQMQAMLLSSSARTRQR